MSGAARPVVLVCAVEAPERSLPGVSAAHWLARGLGAQLHLVHVFDPMSIPVTQRRALRAGGARATTSPPPLGRGPRSGCHVVVAGTRGRGPVASALLGSVSATLMRSARAARRARARDGRRPGGVGAAWLTAARRAAADERERAGVGPVPRAQGLRPWGVARRRHTRRRGMFAPVCGSSRSGCSADSK